MRTFEYQDNKSSKFWKISIEDCTHTVNYGKSGTSGRTQSKSFKTSEEVKKSYEKLIEQKLKKGYVEVGTQNQENKIVSKQDAELTTKSKKDTPEVSITNSESKIEEKVQPKKQRKLNVVRSINLNPEDYLWATWKPRNPLPKPEIRPFDRDYLINHITEIANPYVDWEKADIPVFMSEEEAYFWLAVIGDESAYCPRNISEKPIDLVIKIKEPFFGRKQSLDEVIKNLIRCLRIVKTTANIITSKIALVFDRLFGIAESVVELQSISNLDRKKLSEYAVNIFQGEDNYKTVFVYTTGQTKASQLKVEMSEQDLIDQVTYGVSRILLALVSGFKQYLRLYFR